ncbi:hypothetical protein SO802_007798 [Lithocarpus litseifolius]|uniref:DUF8040 domain-containing protein n=1 Tax=Lithocarpus litseifolius TaxID=425828 RepID=A0AAW2DPP0_9ROSI
MKRPICTSILSGNSYVHEVLEGNLQVCYNIFRMDKIIFRHLCNELKRLQLLEETGIVSVEEVVGVLLFIVGHNAGFQVTANHFQHSLETIQRRFRRAVHALGCLIIRPDVDAAELPHSLRRNGKYYPWFEKCVGAIDGTHISASAPSGRTTAFRDRRSDITQNVMCACNFDMRFRIVLSLDSGYAIGNAFVPPYKSIRYHAQKFRGANRQPTIPQELFNYRHLSLRMVIE